MAYRGDYRERDCAQDHRNRITGVSTLYIQIYDETKHDSNIFNRIYQTNNSFQDQESQTFVWFSGFLMLRKLIMKAAFKALIKKTDQYFTAKG